MLPTTGYILSFLLYLIGTRQSELLIDIYLPSATISSYEGSNARSYASVDPRESSSQISSRATRSTDSLNIPRERHWLSGGSETSRVSDTRTANWVADRSLTGHDSGSTTSSRRSSQRLGHSHRSRPREYEGGTADFCDATRRSERRQNTPPQARIRPLPILRKVRLYHPSFLCARLRFKSLVSGRSLHRKPRFQPL